MKITFIAPSLNLSGGLRVISIYANLLAEKGHQVTVVAPNQRQPNLKEKLKSYIGWRGFAFKNNFDPSHFDNSPINLILLDSFRPVNEKDVPDGDIVIATYWNTSEWVANLPSCKGKKIYFIQHYEIHSWLPVERVEATLRQPFKKIVVARWIADILESEYDQKNITVVPNGVDTNQFHASTRDKQLVTTVGVMYSSKSFKGFDIALEAINIAKKFIPELELIMFGSEQPSPETPMPDGVQYFFRPNQETLRTLYNRCDAWLFSSRFEGFGLPILEAMACRTPVIGTRSGAAPDLINQKNGFLVDIDDAAAIANAIVEISVMPNEKWRKLSQNAYETSLTHTWNESLNAFEQAIQD